MKKILFKVYTNINSFNVIFLNILCLVSALLISLSIYIHPLVGDDYLYKEMVLQNDINFINYFFRDIMIGLEEFIKILLLIIFIQVIYL